MDAPVRIKAWFGCGLLLLEGKRVALQRFRPTNNTEVAYLYVCCFYIPLFPIGCYRIDSETFAIVGQEKWKFGEVFIVYFIEAAIALLIYGCTRQ